MARCGSCPAVVPGRAVGVPARSVWVGSGRLLGPRLPPFSLCNLAFLTVVRESAPCPSQRRSRLTARPRRASERGAPVHQLCSVLAALRLRIAFWVLLLLRPRLRCRCGCPRSLPVPLSMPGKVRASLRSPRWCDRRQVLAEPKAKPEGRRKPRRPAGRSGSGGVPAVLVAAGLSPPSGPISGPCGASSASAAVSLPRGFCGSL